MVDTLSSSSPCTHTIFKPIFTQLFLIFNTRGVVRTLRFMHAHCAIVFEARFKAVLRGAVLGSYQTFTRLWDIGLFDKGFWKKP